jgi:probable rRNA maturation factor
MYHIIIQQISDKTLSPKASLLKKWAKLALSKVIEQGELTIRIVDPHEMKELNATYRHKDYATNVLSFPFSMPEEIDMAIPLLGDIVICADVVNKEAQEQHKTQEAHWAHMIVHGIFHLLGHDHEKEDEAKIMEALEIETLQALGFANPYEIKDER